MKPRQHKAIVIDIEDVARSGAGVGKDEQGRVVFVPFTAPGDKVKVKPTKVKNKFAEAELLEIIEASDQRISPACPVFTLCGGCQWQHLSYEQQWQIKLDGVKQSLRLAKINADVPWQEFPATQQWFYRNRIQLRGYKDKLGFFARQSHDVIEVDVCQIAAPELNQKIAEVKAEAKKQSKSYKVELHLKTDGTVEKVWNQQHGAEGFRQVNDEQNRQLQAWIKNQLHGELKILDLYGGNGNLSRPLLTQCTEMHCVDLSAPDQTDPNLPDYFHFHRSAVYPWLQQRIAQIKGRRIAIGDTAWTALIDPPRDGLGEDCTGIIDCLEKHQADTAVLVGCKTDPWSRDVAQFLNAGWKIKQLAVFDFFPQTFHVETVALLGK